MKARICLAVLVVLTLVVCSGAWAADYTLWQDFNYPPTLGNVDWTQPWNVNQFNMSGMTLLGVEILWSANMSGSWTAQNASEEMSTITGHQQGTLTLQRSTSTLVSWLTGYHSEMWEGVGPGESTDPALEWTNSGTSGITPVSITSNLAPWIGGGTVPLSASETAASGGSGADPMTTVSLVTGGAAFRLRYYYDNTSVPEPCTLALSSLCLLGIGLLRKRRGK